MPKIYRCLDSYVIYFDIAMLLVRRRVRQGEKMSNFWAILASIQWDDETWTTMG